MWQTMTEAQAIVLNGGMTIVAGLVAVLLGGLIFSRQIASIREAHAATEEMMKDHASKVAQLAKDVEGQLSELDQVLAGVSQKVSSIEGTVSDSETVAANRAEAPGDSVGLIPNIPAATEDSVEISLRDRLKKDWHDIRDVIEAIASHPSLDGRTRASFMRVDRRSYTDLINKMQGILPSPELFREAVDLWMANRNGRRAPSTAEVTRMQEVSAQVRALDPVPQPRIQL